MILPLKAILIANLGVIDHDMSITLREINAFYFDLNQQRTKAKVYL